MNEKEYFGEVNEMPKKILGMERNFSFGYNEEAHLLYDISHYTGYFGFVLNEEEECIEATQFDHDEGCIVEGEIHTMFTYEGDNVEEWESEEEMEKHQEYWKEWKGFVKKYKEFSKKTKNFCPDGE